jgi:S1-C subfamily serine protease
METKSNKTDALAALSSAVADAVERAGPLVVAVHGRPRTPSSGVHWRAGVVVTAAHTISRDQGITITLSDGRSLPATLAGRDPGTDLAALRVEEAGEVTSAAAADTAELKPGNVALALGRPGDGQLGPTVSLALVSALGGAWRTWQGGRIDQFIRLEGRIFLGFSGGPLVDSQGRVLGINTTGLWRNTGLTVPVSTLERVLAALLEKGRVPRGYLGVGMQPVAIPEALQKKLNLRAGTGMLIVTVEPGGPADQAGALIGDILMALDGQSLNDMADVQAFLAEEAAGKVARASLVRAGALCEVAITIGERPNIG